MNLESWLYAHTSLLLTVSSEAALAFSGVTYPPACKRIRDSVFTDGFMAKGHQLFRKMLPTGWPDNHRFPSACSERGTVSMPELTSKVSVLLANAPLTTVHGMAELRFRGWRSRRLMMELEGGGTCASATISVTISPLPPAPWDLRNYWPLFPTSDVETEAQKKLLSVEFSEVPFHTLIVSFFLSQHRVSFKAPIMVTKNTLECVVLWWLRGSSWPAKP